MLRKLILVLALSFIAPLSAQQLAPAPELAKVPADAIKESNGLRWIKIAEGTGAKAKPESWVKLTFVIRDSKGDVIEQSRAGRPMLFELERLIPGWRQVVTGMAVGDARRAWIPEALCGGRVEKGESLIVDTTLVDVIAGPKAPRDVAAPPKDALVSESGLRSKIVREGAGSPVAGPQSTVLVHFSGWDITGRLVDTTSFKAVPTEFRLDQVIPGWSEGIQLMKIGEIRRFWVPEKLAFDGRPGKPKGDLVYEIELLAVK